MQQRMFMKVRSEQGRMLKQKNSAFILHFGLWGLGYEFRMKERMSRGDGYTFHVAFSSYRVTI